MSIEIHAQKCIGCGKCAAVCPGSLIAMTKEKKAQIRRPERCWACVSCVKECPVQAIALFLGEDMGGLGGKMVVRREGTLLRWTVRLPDGSEKTVTVNSRDANKY